MTEWTAEVDDVLRVKRKEKLVALSVEQVNGLLADNDFAGEARDRISEVPLDLADWVNLGTEAAPVRSTSVERFDIRSLAAISCESGGDATAAELEAHLSATVSLAVATSDLDEYSEEDGFEIRVEPSVENESTVSVEIGLLATYRIEIEDERSVTGAELVNLERD